MSELRVSALGTGDQPVVCCWQRRRRWWWRRGRAVVDEHRMRDAGQRCRYARTRRGQCRICRRRGWVGGVVARRRCEWRKSRQWRHGCQVRRRTVAAQRVQLTKPTSTKHANTSSSSW